MLFRATSLGPLTSFRTPHVPHPHASSVAADVFALGVIPSSTDYGIYSNLGAMEGLDFAFYKGRSAYHTREDSVPGTAGGVGGGYLASYLPAKKILAYVIFRSGEGVMGDDGRCTRRGRTAPQ